jgi:hypothetical protein
MACAQMKFHKHMHDMHDLLRFKAYLPYKNYLVRISTTKRVLTGFSMKIKIKKITERIKNIK